MVALLHPDNTCRQLAAGHSVAKPSLVHRPLVHRPLEHRPQGHRRHESRPRLRVIEGGRAQPFLARLRWEQIAAGVAATLFVTAVMLVRLLTGTPPASSWDGVVQASTGAPITTSQAIVVADGDTIWSIAAAVAPDADPVVVGQRLIAANGTANLVPGDVLVIPGDIER